MATPKQYEIKIVREIAGPRALRFMRIVMNRINTKVADNLSGKVLKTRTARLKNSIVTEVDVDGLTLRGKIGTNVFYGRIWEVTGRKAFTVRPRDKKALKIPLGAGGKGPFIFRKKARIPAAGPRPFIRPGIEDTQPFIRKLHAKHYQDTIELGPDIEIPVHMPSGGKG